MHTYKDFKLTGMTPDGQAIGTGCVYPASIKTLPDQLKAAGYTWKGYEEDMGNDPTREAATCGHPTLNTTDLTQTPEAPSAAVPLGDQYATRHDPFMYFHSIIDSPDCGQNVVNLSKLNTDLPSVATTANFNFITPEPVRRRPRCAVRDRAARRPDERERIPAEVGAEDHGLAGVQAGRPVDHQLRRKQLRSRDAAPRAKRN